MTLDNLLGRALEAVPKDAVNQAVDLLLDIDNWFIDRLRHG